MTTTPCPCGQTDPPVASQDMAGTGLPPHVAYFVRCPACGRTGPLANSPDEAAHHWADPLPRPGGPRRTRPPGR